MLSLNVRTVSVSSCDSAWLPAFTEISLPELLLRKIITVADLTVCLDRRGPSGKIELYQVLRCTEPMVYLTSLLQDPLLYRCSLTVRLAWVYQTITSKTPHRSVINFLADRLDFSMTGLQLPMVARLADLFLAFHYGELGEVGGWPGVGEGEGEQQSGLAGEEGGGGEGGDNSLGGLLWDVGSSLGTALLPVYWEDEDEATELPPAQLSSQLGFYCREASLTLKAAASVRQKGFYSGGKQCFQPYLLLGAQGLHGEVETKGAGWVGVGAGVAKLSVTPVGQPVESQPYLQAGADSQAFLGPSLFAEQQEEESGKPGRPREWAGPEEDWEGRLARLSETVLLERSPALALDYCYTTGEEEGGVGERALCRVVVGPARLLLTPGAAARAARVQDLLAVHGAQYPPYRGPRPDPGTEPGLSPPSPEEVAALERHIPARTYRLTALHPSLTVQAGQARLEAGLRCAELTHTAPMYPERNVRAASLLQPASPALLAGCHACSTASLVEGWLGLASSAAPRPARLLSLDKASLNFTELLLPEFWLAPQQRTAELTFTWDSLAAAACLAQLGSVVNLLAAASLLESKVVVEAGEAGPALSCQLGPSRVSLSTSRDLLTVGLQLGPAGLSLRSEPGQRAVPVLSGLAGRAAARAGSAPGRAVQETSSGPAWLAGVLQWPRKPVQYEVPTLLHLVLGETAVLLEPGLLLLASQAVQLVGNPAPGPVEPPPSSPAAPAPLSPLQLLRGSLVEVRLAGLQVWLPGRGLAGLVGNTVQDCVARAGRTSGPNPVILCLELPATELRNAHQKAELGQYSTAPHPVLPPPALWLPGRDNFPWSLSLTGFSITRPTAGEPEQVLLIYINTFLAFS